MYLTLPRIGLQWQLGLKRRRRKLEARSVSAAENSVWEPDTGTMRQEEITEPRAKTGKGKRVLAADSESKTEESRALNSAATLSGPFTAAFNCSLTSMMLNYAKRQPACFFPAE